MQRFPDQEPHSSPNAFQWRDQDGDEQQDGAADDAGLPPFSLPPLSYGQPPADQQSPDQHTTDPLDTRAPGQPPYGQAQYGQAQYGQTTQTPVSFKGGASRLAASGEESRPSPARRDDDRPAEIVLPTQIIPPVSAARQPLPAAQRAPAAMANPYGPQEPPSGAPSDEPRWGHPPPPYPQSHPYGAFGGPSPYGSGPQGAFGDQGPTGTTSWPAPDGGSGPQDDSSWSPYPSAGPYAVPEAGPPPYNMSGYTPPTQKKRPRWLVPAAVAAAVLVVGGGGFFAARGMQDDSPQPASHAQNPPAHHRAGGKTVDINSARTDTRPLTVAQVFPTARTRVAGAGFHRVATSSVGADCVKAATGALAPTLRAGHCTRLVRGVYVDAHKRYAVASGIAVLATKQRATAARDAANLRHGAWFHTPRVPPGSGAAKISRTGGYTATVVWGRYLVYSYATYSDGHTPRGVDDSLMKVSSGFRAQMAKAIARHMRT